MGGGRQAVGSTQQKFSCGGATSLEGRRRRGQGGEVLGDGNQKRKRRGMEKRMDGRAGGGGLGLRL